MTEAKAQSGEVYDIFTKEKIVNKPYAVKKCKPKHKPTEERIDNDLLYTGYWGYIIKYKYAWLPVFTNDWGWIWGKRYYKFTTNTGYDPNGWTWVTQCKLLLPSNMKRFKLEFLSSDRLGWRDKKPNLLRDLRAL